MQWLKTWLRKWLGAEEIRTEIMAAVKVEHDMTASSLLVIRDGYVYPAQKELERLCLLLGSFESQLRSDGILIENLGNRMMAVEQKLEFIESRIGDLFTCDGALRAELIDIVKLGERDDKRISELELLVKDATLDTALAAIEDRVAKLETTPIPSGPQGRRGGSAWGPHQVAAAAGAARASGSEVPIPTPGVS